MSSGMRLCIDGSLYLFQSSPFGFRDYLDHEQDCKRVDRGVENESPCNHEKRKVSAELKIFHDFLK